MPRRLDATDPADREAALTLAVAALRAGGVVAFPTETVYGLGARARDASAVEKVYALKGRPPWHPLIVHLGDAEMMDDWACVPEVASRLAEAHWPGPLTMVLRALPGVPKGVTGGAPTVALRVPGHPLALELLRALGEGVAAPSANRYGRVSPTRAEHVVAEFEDTPSEGDAALLVLDGGPCAVGLESTIVDLSGSSPRLLRPGGIPASALAAVVGPFTSARGAEGAAERPPAPGDRPRHYSPDVPTRIVAAAELAFAPPDVAVLAMRAAPPTRSEGAAPWLELGFDASSYARDLYAALRSLEASRPSAIWVEKVPTAEPWRAVADRLGRASGNPPQPEEST